jgi:hypothetical protein
VVEDTSKDAQIERVNTVIAKTFGGDAKANASSSTRSCARSPSATVTPDCPRARCGAHRVADLRGARWAVAGVLGSANDTVRFEVRPDLSGSSSTQTSHPPPSTRSPYDDLKVPFAVDEDGNTIYWRPKRDRTA